MPSRPRGLATPAVLPADEEARLVREFLGHRPGFFVEVGANDPQALSQTFHLEQRGWTGILVEPQPALAAELRARRKARVYDVACTAPGAAGGTMRLALSGAHSSLQDGYFVYGATPDGAIEVPVLTLDAILDDAKAPAPLDFLSIDVEGHERAVLAGCDLARWRPRLLLIEDHVMDTRLHRAITARGYRWFRRTGLNSWYAPVATAPAVSAFGRWQFLRKHYLGLPFRHLRELGRKWRTRQATVRVGPAREQSPR